MHGHALGQLVTFGVPCPRTGQCLLCSGKERASALAQFHAHTVQTDAHAHTHMHMHTNKYSHGFPELERIGIWAMQPI